MIVRYLLISLLLSAGATAATDEVTTTPSAKEMLRARLAEEARNAPANPAAPSPATSYSASTASAPNPPPAADANPLLAPTAGTAAAKDRAAKPNPRAEPATVLPKVEVKKGRITKLDQALSKQDQDIAREKKNTRTSEVDKALNDSKIATPLAIFGGESAQFRKRVASERVAMMEDEKDLIEAIAEAKTKEEKAELQKQLDFLRMERRELERSLR
jgi:hypothetical protein